MKEAASRGRARRRTIVMPTCLPPTLPPRRPTRPPPLEIGAGVGGVCEAGGVCGRYANSRRPEDLVEEFEIERTSGPGPGHDPASAGPHFNVPPTKAPLLVLRRQVKGAPPQATGPGEQPEPDHPTPAA